MSSQYQHFIPQFILRRFSNFGSLIAEGLQGKKARKYCKLSFLNLEDGKIESRNTSRTFGMNNMYLDPSIFPASSVAECAVEKELCALEERAAKILQKIETACIRGDGQFSVTRHEKDELRRFLFIMLYRNRTFERRFEKSKKDYDADDRYNMLIYMRERGIEDPKTVWLNNLLVFLRVPLGPKKEWIREVTEKAYPLDAEWFIMHLESTFLSFCCPAGLPHSNDEFMLTQNAYSIFEGPNDETQWTDWHVFAPVSPNLMIIMRKNVLQKWDDPDMERMRLEQLEVMKSVIGLGRVKPQRLSKLMVLPLERPQVRYSGSPSDGGPVSLFSKDDEFTFKFIRLGTEHLQLLNTIFFEEAITRAGIVFNDRQKFMRMLEHYLAADPMEFKQTYSNDQLLKCHSPLPSSWPRMSAWRKANVTAYLKLLEAAAAELGSDVKARYFDWNFFNLMDGISPEFIRRYEILGGDGSTILYDLYQANSITNLVTMVDRLIQSQPQSFKTRVRQERAKLLTQLPVRRLWLHMRQLRTRVRSSSTNKPEDELRSCTTSKTDGLEDALIDAWHIFNTTRFAEMMYRLWDTQLFLYLNPKFGMGTNNVGVKDSAQLEEEQQLIFGRPGTILVCGIPKLEREAERLYQQCERRAAMETTYSDDGTYMMKLELLLRKSLCDRLDSLLESDLSRVQIRSLRVSLFDNFFRLGSKGRPRLAENV